MAAKVELGDETTLNMTPMIDICFNLVIFFMLTLDLSSKEYMPLTLPFAYHGVQDKDDPKDPASGLKLIVNLLPDGKIVLKGNEYNLAGAGDTPEGKAAQMKALKTLQQQLLLVTSPDPAHPDVREPDGHSKIPVQIHADRASLWRYVQWIIATASSPQIKMYKVYFSVKQPAPDEPIAKK